MRSYKKKGPFRFNCYGPFKNSDNKKKTRKNGQIGTPIGSHQDAVKLNLVDVIQPVISRSTFAYCLFHLALANYLAHIWSPKTRFNKQNHKLNLDINQRLRFRSLFWPDNWKTKI